MRDTDSYDSDGPYVDTSGTMYDGDTHTVQIQDMEGRPRRAHREVVGVGSTVTTAAEVRRLQNLYQDVREALEQLVEDFVPGRALTTPILGLVDGLAETLDYQRERIRALISHRDALQANCDTMSDVTDAVTDAARGDLDRLVAIATGWRTACRMVVEERAKREVDVEMREMARLVKETVEAKLDGEE